MEQAATTMGDCEICGASQRSGMVHTFTARVVDAYEGAARLMGRTWESERREVYHIADFPVFACAGCTTAPKRSRWAKWFDADKTPVEIALQAVLGRIHASLALSHTVKEGPGGPTREIAEVAVRTQEEARGWTEDHAQSFSDLVAGSSGSTTQSVPAGFRRERHSLPVLTALSQMPAASTLSLMRDRRHYLDRHPSFDLRPVQYKRIVETAIPLSPDDATPGPWSYEPCNQAVFGSDLGTFAASLFHDGRGLLLLPDRRMLAFRYDLKDAVK